ncbi:hypothetical protein GF337_10015 [candidate division KSB1 bacterium]|nr:hypothetical protein [candidate division KSB1 bacterium]
MGQTYGNILGDDPMATLFNPANVGLMAQDYYFASSFNSPKIEWLPSFAGDLYYHCNSFTAGINLKDIIGIPVSYGIGYNFRQLDMGKQVITNEFGPEPLGYFDSWDESRELSMSFAMDYFVRASIGFTHKNIKSKLALEALVETNAYDLGFILKIPVIVLAERFELFKAENRFSLKPYFVPGFYYSVTNIGDKVAYIEASQADPIPRNASVGMNIDTGLRYEFRNYLIELFSFQWAREADDLLIKTYSDKPSEYVTGLKDISFWDNILLGKANDKAITKKGWQYNFANIFSLRKGGYEDIEGKVMLVTEGYSINFLQPLKLYIAFNNLTSEDNFFRKLIMHLNVQYHHSEYDAGAGHPLDNTKFNAYVISLSNFPFH